jgi:hypothetical protein
MAAMSNWTSVMDILFKGNVECDGLQNSLMNLIFTKQEFNLDHPHYLSMVDAVDPIVIVIVVVELINLVTQKNRRIYPCLYCRNETEKSLCSRSLNKVS